MCLCECAGEPSITFLVVVLGGLLLTVFGVSAWALWVTDSLSAKGTREYLDAMY